MTRPGSVADADWVTGMAGCPQDQRAVPGLTRLGLSSPISQFCFLRRYIPLGCIEISVNFDESKIMSLEI